MSARKVLPYFSLLTLLLLVCGRSPAQQGGDTISSIKGTRSHAPAGAAHRPRSAVRRAAPRHIVAARPSARVTPRRVAVRAARHPNRAGGKPARFASRPSTGDMVARMGPAMLTGFPMIGVWYLPQYDAADKFGHWSAARDSHSGTPILGNYSSNDPAVIRSQYQAMRECGVNFLILNDNQTVFGEGGSLTVISGPGSTSWTPCPPASACHCASPSAGS